MDDLTKSARTVAEEAISQGGDPGDIGDAMDSLAEGDAFKAEGKYKDSVNKYKDALAKVT